MKAKTIFEADDGRQFFSEHECRMYEQRIYEQDSSAFSFARNVVLDEYGRRLLPLFEELKRAVDAAYYIKFQTKQDRENFAILSKKIGSQFMCDYIQNLPSDILEFAWLHSEQRFIPVRGMLRFCQNAIEQLDKYNFDNFLVR